MYTKIKVEENQRVIVSRRNRFAQLLPPGAHWVFNAPMLRLGLEWHELRFPLCRSKWTRFLIHKRPDIVAQHFVAIETGPLEIAMVSVNGQLNEMLLPEKVGLFWKDAGKVTIERVNIGADYAAPSRLFSRFEPLGISADLDEIEDWLYEAQEET